MQSGHVPLSLDWQFITRNGSGQTRVAPCGRPDDTLNRMHSDNNQDRTWPSPAADGPVSARVRLPASKSITNRALVLAALSDGPAVIANPLRARDTILAAAALRVLGTGIDEENTESRTAWRVMPGQPAPGSAVSVDVGNAGTVMRFLPGPAALTSAVVAFDGDVRARQRPVGPILAALRQLGAHIEDGGRAAVPFTVHGRGAVRGGTVVLDASGSSQLVSGLLLSAPRFDEGIEIRHEGPPVPSAPHIAMTVRMLRAAGAEVAELVPGLSGADARPDTWRVRPGRLALGAVTVEPDLSNAGPFLAAALVTGGTVTIPDWPRDSLQAAGAILDVLTRMGARCVVGADGLTITGTGRIVGITADLRDVNELAPVLTAAAAVAESPSVFTGLAHTRTHETDRLAALAKEINALGGDITELPDGLQIRPRPLRAGAAGEPFGSYDDHRMVMAAAVLGLVVPGIRVAGADTVAKTFPDFSQVWAGMLGPES
jgi:3-phosphoshikimate 1-carboxyvinyltransferase